MFIYLEEGPWEKLEPRPTMDLIAFLDHSITANGKGAYEANLISMKIRAIKSRYPESGNTLWFILQ